MQNIELYSTYQYSSSLSSLTSPLSLWPKTAVDQASLELTVKTLSLPLKDGQYYYIHVVT